MKRLAAKTLAFLAALTLLTHALSADQDPPAPKPFDALVARPVGPCNMGGRICDLAVVESDPNVIYIGAATGGVWKTVNAGKSWTPLFDDQPNSSIGDITVAPSNPDIVWVGTGEANPRNSVSWGDGVYKSADGGKTWQHMGLKETQHIGRIVIHPKDPDIVYVAALGRIWGPNKERGVYKTANGGKTWEQVKFIDENTGFIDVALDPSEPDTLYAAAYCVRRDAYSGGNPRTQFGPGAGLYKTTDGGKSWTKLAKGLPVTPYGRCGLDVYRKDPRIVYAVIQTEKTNISKTAGQPPRAGTEVETGGVFRSEDKGESWIKVNDLCPRPFYYGQIRIDPSDDKRIYVLGVSFFTSVDGGKNFNAGPPEKGATGPRPHPDHHALWINPKDSNHLVLGNDGGLYFSKDRIKTWEHINNIPLGQFYEIGVDNRQPYRVYGGLQDNGSWGGPTATRTTDGITNADWFRVAGADGFYCQVDPFDPDIIYCEGQYGRLQRANVKARPVKTKGIAPAKQGSGYRFNWDSPVVASKHKEGVLYYGGNVVFKSSNRGDKWEKISPDLTRFVAGTSTTSGHSLTALAESPLKAGLLWAGADDGTIHVSRDDGKNWTDLSKNVPNVPAERWVNRIEPSRYAEGTAYLAIDRHRNDDQAPYLFKTTDHGATWQPLANDLPANGSVHVIREDPRNKDLLYVGTEFGLFASLDGGAHWHRLRGGLPTVPIHDLVIHPRDRELVIGTHGRSVYVMDIAPLQDLTADARNAVAHLFDVKPVTLAKLTPRQPAKERDYSAPNPVQGATVHYHLKAAADAGYVEVDVTDAQGKKVAELKAPGAAGLNRLVWKPLPAPVQNGEAHAAAGEYTITLKLAGGKELSRKVKVAVAE